MNYYYVAVVVLNSWKCVLEHVYIGEFGDIQAKFVPSQKSELNSGVAIYSWLIPGNLL